VGFFPAYRQAGLILRMTITPVILNAVKDPMAFSIAQLSLHCMGFFASAQNDSRGLLWVGFLPLGRQASFRMTVIF